jgi:two-component system sensor histidine kinase MprB
VRVLVVDDDPGVRTSVAAALRRAGALLLVALLAVLVARKALSPVTALTRATELVVQTGDLRQRVRVGGRGRDETGRLAASVNAMLTAWSALSGHSGSWLLMPHTS